MNNQSGMSLHEVANNTHQGTTGGFGIRAGLQDIEEASHGSIDSAQAWQEARNAHVHVDEV